MIIYSNNSRKVNIKNKDWHSQQKNTNYCLPSSEQTEAVVYFFSQPFQTHLTHTDRALYTRSETSWPNAIQLITTMT